MPNEAQAVPVSAHTAVTPTVRGGDATIYVLPRESLPAQAAKHEWQEMWGPSVIAAFVALMGVMLPLIVKWIADRRDRRLALRRDIYLKVVDAVTEAAEALGTLADVDVPLSETMKKFGVAAAAISKAEVVAAMPLVSSLALLQNTTQAYLAELMRMRVELERAQGRIKIDQKHIDDLQVQINENLAKQWQMNIDGQKDGDGRFARLQGQFKFLQDRQHEHHNNHLADFALRQKTIEAMGLKVMDMRSKMISLEARVLSLIREDLELKDGFEMEEFLSIKRDSSNAAKKFVEDIQRETS